jgi:hypothetical protein
MISKEDIFKFSPCAAATQELVDRIFGERELLTAKDVLELDLKDEYKLWLLLRPQLLTERSLEKIRADFIELMDQQWLIDLSVSCPVYDMLGKVARCFDRPYEETYAVLLRIAGGYVA